MKTFYSSSCRKNLSVITFCSNINKKYISQRLLHFSCLFVHVITLNADFGVPGNMTLVYKDNISLNRFS